MLDFDDGKLVGAEEIGARDPLHTGRLEQAEGPRNIRVASSRDVDVAPCRSRNDVNAVVWKAMALHGGKREVIAC